MLRHLRIAGEIAGKAVIRFGGGVAYVIGLYRNKAGRCPMAYIGQTEGYFGAMTPTYELDIERYGLPERGQIWIRGNTLYGKAWTAPLEVVAPESRVDMFAQTFIESVPEPVAFELKESTIRGIVGRAPQKYSVVLRVAPGQLTKSAKVDKKTLETIDVKPGVQTGKSYPVDASFAPLEITIDPCWLEEATKIITPETIVFSTTDDAAPIMLTAQGCRMILAPMRY